MATSNPSAHARRIIAFIICLFALLPVSAGAVNEKGDWPCSDKLLTSLCDSLVANYEREGSFEKRVYSHTACELALLAGGDSKYDGPSRKDNEDSPPDLVVARIEE